MGHHINQNGEFQSDKHPDLPPDKIILSFKDPRAHGALLALAEGYMATDLEFSDDIRARVTSVKHPPVYCHDGLVNIPFGHPTWPGFDAEQRFTSDVSGYVIELSELTDPQRKALGIPFDMEEFEDDG